MTATGWRPSRAWANSTSIAPFDLLQDGKFPDENPSYQFTRSVLAVILAETDPAAAEAMAEAIPMPDRKAEALAYVARSLPASERGRKRDLLERVTFLLRNDLKRGNVGTRLFRLTSLAEQWLDLGDRDRARPLLEEGRSIFDSSPAAIAVNQPEFLAQLARLEPDQALERLRKLPDPTKRARPLLPSDPPAEVAVAIATDHPAEAERIFNLWGRSGSSG